MFHGAYDPGLALFLAQANPQPATRPMAAVFTALALATMAGLCCLVLP